MNSFKFSIPVKFPIRLESIIVDAEITVSLESADGVSSQPSVFPTEMSVRTSSRVLSSVDSASDDASDVTSSDAFSVTLSVEASSETLSADVFSVSFVSLPDSNSLSLSVSAGTVFCADAARINCVASLLFPSRNALLLVVKSVVSVTSSGVYFLMLSYLLLHRLRCCLLFLHLCHCL